MVAAAVELVRRAAVPDGEQLPSALFASAEAPCGRRQQGDQRPGGHGVHGTDARRHAPRGPRQPPQWTPRRSHTHCRAVPARGLPIPPVGRARTARYVRLRVCCWGDTGGAALAASAGSGGSHGATYNRQRRCSCAWVRLRGRMRRLKWLPESLWFGRYAGCDGGSGC